MQEGALEKQRVAGEACASIPQDMFSVGKAPRSGRKKVKIVIRKESAATIAEMAEEHADEPASTRKAACSIKDAVRRFSKKADSDLDVAGEKMCLNCGGTRVVSTRAETEPQARCTDCNKEFPARYALMLAEACFPCVPRRIRPDKADKSFKTDRKDKKDKRDRKESRKDKNDRKMDRRNRRPDRAMSAEEADSILKSRAERLSFVYVAGLARNRIGLTRRAILAKVRASSRDIANIAFVGRTAEIIVSERVAGQVKAALEKTGLRTVDWNPAGGEGEAKFRARMRRTSTRQGVPHSLARLAAVLADAEGGRLAGLLEDCGVRTGRSTVRGKPRSEV